MNGCEMCSCFNSRFSQLRPEIHEHKISKHLLKDIKDSNSIIEKILSCEHTCSSELHKFEKKMGKLSIFRAKIDGRHIVYAINDKKVLFFLRAFKNFTSYKKFLDSEKDINAIVVQLE